MTFKAKWGIVILMLNNENSNKNILETSEIRPDKNIQIKSSSEERELFGMNLKIRYLEINYTKTGIIEELYFK
ncbi:hypothetical protein [uncultured Ilyobacter sp.]|uniref:hypothetical protein n=1 Tax=uncultured Ilyobacter sp. TaxID=544433 RepID=UPI003749335D